MEAPLIDPRTHDEIVARTAQLAREFSGWEPGPGGQPDPGGALISIFGRFAELVIERLNRSPDKHYLAFLNLIGASPLPPRPARVPLTFHLAAGSPVDAAVPAGTLAAAPPLAGEQDDVTFETERPLVVTRTPLQAVYVSDTESDTYDDRFAQATGASDEPFPVFAASRPSPHQLYLACDPLLAQPGTKDVLLALASPDAWQWLNWPIKWAYWDGAGWHGITVSAEVRDGAWRVNLPALPALAPSLVNRIEAGWLRAELAMPLPPGVSGQVPESIAIGAKNPQDLTLPLSPFADGTTKRFYLSADEAFAAGGARVTIRVRLSAPGAGNVRLDWLYRTTGAQWNSLGKSGSTGQADPGSFEFTDSTRAFTQDGEVSFHVPVSWPRTLFRTRTGRWLRVDVTDDSGPYTTPPVISELTVDTGWALPRVGDITVTSQQGTPSTPVPPAAAFADARDVDLTMDFYPLGHQPQFNDTCYIACPDALARPGAIITLAVTLTNPPAKDPPKNPLVPPVRTDGHPKITWEVSDGSRWHAAADATYAFTDHGEVRITLPDPLGQAQVNGTQGYWLRARLTDGNYGRPATYVQNDDGTYTYKAADLAPPVVKTITVSATAPAQQQTPVTACLSYNDFRYLSHGREDALFPPFTPTADDRPALYLGFGRPFGPQPVTLFLEVEPPLPEQVAAEQPTGPAAATSVLTSWEYASPDGWQPLGAADETRTLSSRGLVTFAGPEDLIARQHFGQTLYWLRLHWQAGTFPLPPRLRRVLLNTTWAAQVTTVTNEILGSGTGDPGQAFTAAHTPVQPGQQLTVREPRLPVPAEEEAIADEGADAISVTLDTAGHPEDVWVRWHAVPDFYQSGPRDRHYTADPLSGVIRFGDGTSGMIPPTGQNNIRMTYRVGGGEQGNRASATIVELKSGIPYLDGVTNNQPSQGGAPAEPIDRVKTRGPRILRHRDRAVAVQDLQDLALAASADVAIATAVVPIFNPYSLWLDPDHPIPTQEHEKVHAGRMGVVIVPDEPGSARPTPSLVLLSQVQDYLLERCPPTAGLWVSGPEWIAISVQATVAVTSVDEAGQAVGRARTALTDYLHPLTGGPAGQGWALGTWPHASDLSALLETIQGVDHVDGLTLTYRPQTPDEGRELALRRILERPLTDPGEPPERQRDLLNWLARALVYSGPHDISVMPQ